MALLLAQAAASAIDVGLFWATQPRQLQIDGRAARVGSYPPNVHIDTGSGPPLQLPYPIKARFNRNGMQLIVSMPLEDYVAGVLIGEAGGFNSLEALKAMAVAARTFARRNAGRHRAEGFDVCDTTHCQDIRFDRANERIREAVDATEGEVLWVAGRTATAYYHRHCGGTTEAAGNVWPDQAAPHLRQSTDPFCVARGRLPWDARLSKRDIAAALGLSGAITTLEVAERTPSGRARIVSVDGRRLTAENLHIAIGRALGWQHIRSTAYEAANDGTHVRFRGYGAGHGVGLCQTGAEQRGLAGHSYRDILGFYFPGAPTGVSAQGLQWTRLGFERMEILSTQPNQDRSLGPPAERAFREAESITGMIVKARPRLRVYPSVGVFRDATGEPGYVAASTLGATIRMQPAALLRSQGRLESILRHEFLHVVVESNAHPSLPDWFREGLVLALDGSPAPPAVLARDAASQSLRRFYADSRARVEKLIQQHGRATVLSWVSNPNLGYLPSSTRNN